MSSRIIRVLDVLSEQNVRLVHVTRASERNSNGNRMPDTVYRRQESQRMGEIEIDHKFHARRWVICVSRAYVHVASFRKLGYYPGMGTAPRKKMEDTSQFLSRVRVHIFSNQSTGIPLLT